MTKRRRDPPKGWATGPSGGPRFIANVAIVLVCGAIGAWFVLAKEDRVRLFGRWAG